MMDNLVILRFAEAKQPEYRERKGQGYIEFGERNDYPNYLLSLYNKSAKHNAIVRGKVNYITGNGWTTKESDPKADLFINAPNPFESLNDLTRKVSIDIELFGGAYLEIIWSKVGGMISSINHIDYTKIRSNKDNTQFWYKDWSDRKEQPEVINAFNTGLRKGKQILYIKEYRPGLDTYSLPGYIGALNYIESDVEVSKHCLGNAQTGFSASKLITLPNGEPTPDEKRNIERRFTDRFSGSDGKKFILSFVQDIGKKPVVDDLGASDLTKEDFTQVDTMIQQNLFAGHQITAPDLFGISTPGQLGSRNQIRDAYEIFKNTYVNDKQQFLESIFNQLARINGVTQELYIQPVEPISFEFSENIISQFAPKDWILEKIGVDMSKYQPTPDVTTAPANAQTMINEHLKGMKGREWQNFQRIIRDFNKGKITREQAVQMLQSGFGLDNESISTWLGQEEFNANDIDSIISIFDEYGVSSEEFNVIATRQVFSSDNIESEELAFATSVLEDSLDKKIVDIIAKNKRIPPEDIAKALKVQVEEVQTRLSKLEEMGIVKYNPDTKVSNLTKSLSEILDSPQKTTFLIRYSYEWKPEIPYGERNSNAHPSRPFCVKLMQLNRFYSRADIEQLTQRLGYDVFARGGGWWGDSPSCRHRWVSKIVVKKN